MMKPKHKIRLLPLRLFCVLLAGILCLCGCSKTESGESGTEPSQDTEENPQGIAAETDLPEAQAPETNAPETDASETAEPETEARVRIPETVVFDEPESGIFTPNEEADYNYIPVENHQITEIEAYLHPEKDANARALGDRCAEEMKANFIADFEKNEAYCLKHPEDHTDMMVHVSTFTIIDGVIYMTYYANTGSAAEDPTMQEARFAFCPYDDPSNMTIVRLQKVGDTLDGRTITGVYDTILLHKDDDELYLMWTAAVDGMYYRLWCTYTIATGTISAIRPNRFRVGDVTNDFSSGGIFLALAANSIPFKSLWSDIGIMQKLTSRVENGEVWYYTGAYSGNFNCIIKSRDLVTWEYVSTPDFPNMSVWENATYVLGDKCYYYVRQSDCGQGFLTCYDLIGGTWATPVIISDTQSRSDFIYYKDELYLIHAPIDRNGFGIVKINREDLGKSEVILVADMKDSLFYPYTLIYDNWAYMSYTVNRKHIRLTRFDLDAYLS